MGLETLQEVHTVCQVKEVGIDHGNHEMWLGASQWRLLRVLGEATKILVFLVHIRRQLGTYPNPYRGLFSLLVASWQRRNTYSTNHTRTTD